MPNDNILQDQIAKKSAGFAAADFVQERMVVGLGTGSTAHFFIEKLIERCHQGLKILAVATSYRSENLARQGGIPIIDINILSSIDLTVDGADEIDKDKCMIKGGGGALLREKIIASMSKEMVVVVDQRKLVDRLGRFPLPVEIVPFAYTATIHRIEKLGHSGKLRVNSSGEIYVTDNGNYIYDIHFKDLIKNPQELHHQLREIVGVVESGLFIHLAGRVVIGYNDGRVEIRS
jgi:ribose 5-phosphate isomerase A